MNDLFYSNSQAMIRELESGRGIQELFLERKGRMSGVDLNSYETKLKEATSRGVEVIDITHSAYPKRLRHTPNPPLVLYKRGKDLGFENAVAVAGRRNLSFSGHQAARKLGQGLASHGFLVVSGLARGADTEAHCGALEAGGETVAVLAGWLDDIYPRENANLARDIIRRGALLTMTSPLKQVQKHFFIRRNRITSGVSRLLIIVESNGRGGTMRQVDWALEQERPVFTLKPDKTNKEATNAYRQLVAEGAKGFDDVDELIGSIEALDFSERSGHIERDRRITDYSNEGVENR